MKEEKVFENTDLDESISSGEIGAVIRDASRDKANKELKQWYENFLKYFGECYSTLSEDEKRGIDNTNNYLNPCQIEVFWIANPSMQFIVLSNLENRPDMEVIVNGPYPTNEFLSKVQSILQEPHWNQKIENPFQVDITSNHQYTYAERLANQLHHFMEYSKTILYNSVTFTGSGGGQGLSSKVWVEEYVGNIAKEDYKEKVDTIIQGIKLNAKYKIEQMKNKPTTANPPKPATNLLPTERNWDGFGVHLFPPYVVGKKTRPSVPELLYGHPGLTRRDKVFDMDINGCKIIVNKDGLIFVEFTNKSDAVRVFNVVMALGILEGYPLFAVRERDLSFAKYDHETMTVTEQQWHLQTIRATLRDSNRHNNSYLGYQVQEIPAGIIRSIIEKAFVVDTNEKLAENLRLFTEAFTHLENGEYAQSFIMAWSVIERKYSSIWKMTLDDLDLDHERYSKLTNSAQWSFDYIVEALSLNGEINDQEYDFLMELKRKRNKIYHNGKIVSHEDAKRCFSFISDILKTEIMSSSK